MNETRLKEIEARKAEIRSLLEDTSKDVNLDEINKELDSLNKEQSSIEERAKIARSLETGEETPDRVEKVPAIEETEERKGKDNMKKEYRSAYLKHLRGAEMTEAEKRAFTVSGAGSVIPVETANEIIKKLKDQAPLLNEITLLNVKGNVKFAVEGVKTDAAKHTENASINADGDTLVTVSLNGYEVTKKVQVSDSVMTMSNDAFEDWLTSMIAEMLADKICTLIIKGSGTDEATGVEKANTWGDTNSVTVAAASSLTEANVQKLMSLLKAGYSKNAKFLMSNETLFNDFMPLQNLAKNSIVTERDGVYYVYGKEVMLSEDVAAHEAYLGNFKKYVGNLSEDVTIVSAFDIDTNSYKYLGKAIFDGKTAIGEAFVKLVKAAAGK